MRYSNHDFRRWKKQRKRIRVPICRIHITESCHMDLTADMIRRIDAMQIDHRPTRQERQRYMLRQGAFIVVRKYRDNKYALVSGIIALEAVKRSGQEVVACYLTDAADKEAWLEEVRRCGEGCE